MEKNIKKNVIIFFLRSIDPEIHLQKIKISTLNSFDDKRCCINKNKSKPWE